MDIGQRRLIEELYLEMYDKLLTYARCSLDGESLAEEAVQEAVQIACQKIDSLQESPNPRGWMFNTVKIPSATSSITRRMPVGSSHSI